VVVFAIAARSRDRAQEFAKKWGIQKVYGGQDGYQELLNDAEIDAVYIGVRMELSYRALTYIRASFPTGSIMNGP